MDEVDGMSAGDRGGVGALNALIKKTRVRLTIPIIFNILLAHVFIQVPIICICNDRSLQKMKPLVHTTYNLSFRKLVGSLSTLSSSYTHRI
jgi:replication factor C subunit 1